MMVYRIYVEKRSELATEAKALLEDLRSFLNLTGLKNLRLLNRYDVEGIDEAMFNECVSLVFSEPQTDLVYRDLSGVRADHVFAVEYLPGQFDQRADSAAQCVQIISQGQRPTVRTAKVYALTGKLTPQEIEALKKYLINPVECREASLDPVDTLITDYPAPAPVRILTGFRSMGEGEIEETIREFGLAMDRDDLAFCRDFFKNEGRDPSVTELKLLDTYWSDHCRHTTFQTILDSVEIQDPILQAAWDRYMQIKEKLGRTKPPCLMDLGTIAAKVLKAEGKLDKLDESDEINACTVKIKVKVTQGETEDWLLLFKNETHNHPTEIEPFGGAATCIGGAIRDPLSGRSYVYAAMRVTGAADPLQPISATLPGKLPQKKIVTSAAAGYSSYGNQIGLPTGIVDEWYHPGFAAKRLEIGAVLGAAPAKQVRREVPAPGDLIILLGGRTGRDGIGGATGSSKSHTLESLEHCGAEVQKGNAPEERKLQRLFRNPEAALMIKRCNDFGAGGVSVAIGELADGLKIDLNKVPKKYEGLDGTELAISESQERMAVVVSREDAERFCALADAENLEATILAEVTEEKRLVMDWNGSRIVDLPRSFLDSNGAEKHITIEAPILHSYLDPAPEDFCKAMTGLAGDLNLCSRRGLGERFDSTIGSGTVLMPYGGSNQLTPIQAMVHLIPMERSYTENCSYMAWGYDPYISEKSPYHGAYLAVVESVCKLIASGADFEDVYLSFQEYFKKPGKVPARWGEPFAALLGALEAQLDLGVAAIGGKDSMSGTFEQLDVPPTLVSFAVTMGERNRAISPEFKRAGSRVVLLRPKWNEWGLPEPDSLKAVFREMSILGKEGLLLSAWTVSHGGVADGVLKMCFGNGLGFRFDDERTMAELFDTRRGAFIVELSGSVPKSYLQSDMLELGETLVEPMLYYGSEVMSLSALQEIWEDKLEPVYPTKVNQEGMVPAPQWQTNRWPKPLVANPKPRVLIPVFPGTNCEYDTAKPFNAVGAEPEIFVIRNQTQEAIRESAEAFAKRLRESQILFIPGGFSGGDEPDGSGKFIEAFLRNGRVSEALTDLLDARLGLVCGICNGFQALIKLGLVPYGKITPADEESPTLTFNSIGRHQSRIVRTRVASNKSPWLQLMNVGETRLVPISHGEGRLVAPERVLKLLGDNGQIVTQYADESGRPSMSIRHNPNNSMWAIEGICSPDGRVLGKMGHCERLGNGLYRNVPGNYNLGLFRSAVNYYR